MKLYVVTFAWDTDRTIYCTNMARAKSAEAVERYYERNYHVLNVREAKEYEYSDYTAKGMPVIDIP